jgi:hypothetical protein
MNERELAAGVIVALAKIRQIRESGQDPHQVADLKELEKALGLMASFCDGQDEVDVGEWRDRMEGLRKDMEQANQGFQGTISEYSLLLERVILGILERRLPEGEYRDKVKQQLLGFMPEGEDRASAADEAVAPSSRPLSDLERKLERVDSDVSSSGLDRFIGKEPRPKQPEA